MLRALISGAIVLLLTVEAFQSYSVIFGMRSNSINITTVSNNDNDRNIANGDILFLNSNNHMYDLVTDPEAYISEYCGMLKRNFETCMWQESQNKTYYEKKWVSKPVVSDHFVDKRYVNPKISLQNSISFKTTGISTGRFRISNDLKFLTHNWKKLYPTQYQINQFMQSHFANEFRYFNNGYFYTHPDHNNLDQQSDDVCIPGEKRMFFEYWAPEEMSIVGEYQHGFIINTKYLGQNYGLVAEGKLNLNQLLKKGFKDNQFKFRAFIVLAIVFFAWTGNSANVIILALILSTNFWVSYSNTQFNDYDVLFISIIFVLIYFVIRNNNQKTETRNPNLPN